MKRWLPVILAAGVSLGLVVAYLLAGGASYKPLDVADPCQPRSPEVLAQRGVFEGILLSGLDGAACELGVTREELTAAFGSEEALQEFSAEHGLDPDRIEEAVRAGLVRAVDDAQSQGRLPGAVAAIARALAENAPVMEVISLFEAIPGDPSLADVLEAVSDAGLTLDSLGDSAQATLEELFGGLGLGLPEGLDPSQLLPEDFDPSGLGISPGDLGLDPDRLDQGLKDLRDNLEGLGALIP